MTACGLRVEAGLDFTKPPPWGGRGLVEVGEGLTLARMLPLVRRRFWISGNGQSSADGVPGGEEMELMAAIALPRHQAGVHEKFALVFRADGDGILEQGIFGVTIPGMGAVDLLLTPIVARVGCGRQYEAIINRESPPERARGYADHRKRQTIWENTTTRI